MTIASVGSQVFSDTSGGLVTTLASTAFNLPAGHLVTVVVKWETASAVTSVTDTAGNTYTACTPADDTTQGQHAQVFYCLSSTANATNIVTITWPASSAQYLTATVRWSSYAGTASLTAQTQAIGGSGTAVTTSSFAAGGFAVAAISDFAGANTTPGSGWTEDADVPGVGGHALSRYDTPGGSYVADATLSTGAFWAIAAASFSDSGAGGPNITSLSGANPPIGSTLTITGTAFGATQGAGSVTVGGVTQAVTSWADTSIDITVSRGTNKYGTALNVVVTDNALTPSSAFALTSIQPQAGWSFVNIGTPNTTADNRVTSSPDLASGDQVAYNTQSNGVAVLSDGTFSAVPGVLSFDFEVWSSGGGWGLSATQTITGRGVFYAKRRVRGQSSTGERTPGSLFGIQAAPTPGGLFDVLLVQPVPSGSSGSVPTSLAAAVQLARTLAASAQAAVQASASQTSAVGAAVQAAGQAVTSLGAAAQQALAATSSLQAAVQASPVVSASLGLAVQAAATAAANVGAAVSVAQAVGTSLQAQVQAANAASTGADAMVLAGSTATAGLQVPVLEARSAAAQLQAAVQLARTIAADLQAAVQAAAVASASVQVAVQAPRSASASLDANVQAGSTASVGLNANVQGGATVAAELQAAVRQALSAAAAVDLAIAVARSAASSVGAAIAVQGVVSAAVQAAVLEARLASAGLSVLVFDPSSLVTPAARSSAARANVNTIRRSQPTAIRRN